MGEEGDLLEQPRFRWRLLVGVSEANVSGCFLRSEVCFFLIEPFSRATEVNESIPETCGRSVSLICFPGISWQNLTYGMRSPLLFAQSQSVGVLSVHAPPAGQSKSWDHSILWLLGDVRVWACKMGRKPSCAPVCPWAWTNGATALISQSCCVGQLSESVTSGKEQKLSVRSIGAEISGGWNNRVAGV